MSNVYEPHDDSFLLAQVVKDYAKGRVLDMGTGSGYQAATAASLKRIKEVVAVDVNPAAVKACSALKNKKITCKKSDLFSALKKEQFDTIIFNPPYLPQEGKSPILALEGGKHGYEVIERFLDQVGEHLTSNGQVLLLFSSHSKPEIILSICERNLLSHERITLQQHFFEELFVYRITKSMLRQRLERKGVQDLHYFAQGKRGLVLKGNYKEHSVAIKVKRPSSEAEGRIANEARFLQIVNKHGIGPQFIASGKGYVIYRFVKGQYVKDWLRLASPQETSTVLQDILRQCYELDKLGITKEEMHRPLTNAIVKDSRATLLDFERSHYSKDPKNVSQFCQFLRNRHDILLEKRIDIPPTVLLRLVRSYQQRRDQEHFTALQRLIQEKKKEKKI
ncbi:methyltransferase [Candidatus Woesearchaeota archaeon]|nr:methyltransferase [Candidatus Woesearchaeota archaeon]